MSYVFKIVSLTAINLRFLDMIISHEIVVIGMKFYFLVFIGVLTPANHSQIE